MHKKPPYRPPISNPQDNHGKREFVNRGRPRDFNPFPKSKYVCPNCKYDFVCSCKYFLPLFYDPYVIFVSIYADGHSQNNEGPQSFLDATDKYRVQRRGM